MVGWEVMYDETYSIKAKNFFALWAVEWYARPLCSLHPHCSPVADYFCCRVNMLIYHMWFQTVIVVIGDPFWMPPIVFLTAILSGE